MLSAIICLLIISNIFSYKVLEAFIHTNKILHKNTQGGGLGNLLINLKICPINPNVIFDKANGSFKSEHPDKDKHNTIIINRNNFLFIFIQILLLININIHVRLYEPFILVNCKTSPNSFDRF